MRPSREVRRLRAQWSAYADCFDVVAATSSEDCSVRAGEVVEIVEVSRGGLVGVDDVRDDKAVRQILDCLRVEVDLVEIEVESVCLSAFSVCLAAIGISLLDILHFVELVRLRFHCASARFSILSVGLRF